MRKSRRSFTKEAKREPYELDLDTPTEDGIEFVVFGDPNRLGSESAFDLSIMNPGEIFELLLSPEHYKAWWAEWRTVPIEETNALLDDIMTHYGAHPGKLRR